ncbi:MAG: type II secretion system protein [Planctomycetota bacterium]|jgi:prepilin-type N-terminal cleavage/methylation domain-containing protein
MLEPGGTQYKGERLLGLHAHNLDISCKHARGLSLFELLVVLAVIAIWMAVMLPASVGIRKDAQGVWCMDNQRNVVIGASSYAAEHDCRYPKSVATIGQLGEYWNWQEPTMLTTYRRRSPQLRRSMSAYMRSYIPDASIMFCPSAPEKYKFLEEVWEGGDEWNNPKTAPEQDPAMGTYCFYWNYIGFLDGRDVPFKGAQSLGRERGESQLLVSDYFGYGHWRNRLIYNDCKAYGSCEKFSGAAVTPGTWVSSAYWSQWVGDEEISLEKLRIELHAGYIDGHVERYSASEVVPMRVSQTPDGTIPYPSDLGPGTFYLPRNALR